VLKSLILLKELCPSEGAGAAFPGMVVVGVRLLRKMEPKKEAGRPKSIQTAQITTQRIQKKQNG
jgi:hypothetical protein